VGGHIDEGRFNSTSLSGLNWAFIIKFPGEIAEGHGQQQVIIDERANPEQREALRKILHGDATAPGATHFFIYNSMCSHVFEPLFLPIEYENDIEARRATLVVPDVIHSVGSPIFDEFSGSEFRAGISRPEGSFEFSHAEIGTGTSTVTSPINLELSNSYGQFNRLYLNQDGVVS